MQICASAGQAGDENLQPSLSAIRGCAHVSGHSGCGLPLTGSGVCTSQATCTGNCQARGAVLPPCADFAAAAGCGRLRGAP